jgi:hypothetical protein
VGCDVFVRAGVVWLDRSWIGSRDIVAGPRRVGQSLGVDTDGSAACRLSTDRCVFAEVAQIESSGDASGPGASAIR